MSGQTGAADTVATRVLGSTGLVVSVVGFGASPLGDVFGRVEPAESLRAVHAAVDRGVRLFDVAPYYGDTLAETRLGEALEGRRERVVLATKCGRYARDHFDFSAAAVTRGFEDSLRRLRTDHVDLLQVHDVEFAEPRQIVEETLPALEKLRTQGKALHIGITGYVPDVLLKVAESSAPETMLNYCHWNLLSRDMDDRLTPYAKAHGIGLINASPLHMGVLTQEGPPGWHPAPADVVEAGRSAAALCAAAGASLPEMAMRLCLRHPYVSATLVGIASEAQLMENLQALIPSDQADALLLQLEALLLPVRDRHWPSGLQAQNADTTRSERGEDT